MPDSMMSCYPVCEVCEDECSNVIVHRDGSCQPICATCMKQNPNTPGTFFELKIVDRPQNTPKLA